MEYFFVRVAVAKGGGPKGDCCAKSREDDSYTLLDQLSPILV